MVSSSDPTSLKSQMACPGFALKSSGAAGYTGAGADRCNQVIQTNCTSPLRSQTKWDAAVVSEDRDLSAEYVAVGVDLLTKVDRPCRYPMGTYEDER